MIEKMQLIKDDLVPVVMALQAEGIEVYTYTCMSNRGQPVNSLYWYDNKNHRVLNIQPNYFGGYNLSVSYVPSYLNGSGCGLSSRDGIDADSILQYRDYPTWVKGIQNYKDMA